MRRIIASALLVAGVIVPAVATAPSYAAKPRCHGQLATIVGSDRSEQIKGTKRDDVIVGRGGKDVIDGRGGTDLICGDGGNDRLRSGKGGLSTLDGGLGKDDIVSEGEDDEMLGGPGNDELAAVTKATLAGGPGDDRLLGSGEADTFTGGDGRDTVFTFGGVDVEVHGGPGDDWIEGQGTDLLHGDGGNDAIYSGPGQATNMWGDAGNDTLTVQGPDGVAGGGAGDDVITGGPSADTLLGDAGNDSIYAGDGDDTCDGGEGTDTCHGGAPGGQENTPTDPDRCEAETTYSCRHDGLSYRWRLEVTGKSTHERPGSYKEVTTWSFHTDMEVTSVFQDVLNLVDVDGTGGGSYEFHGSNGGCEVSGSGIIEPPATQVSLHIDQGDRTFGWNWTTLESADGVRTCPDHTKPYSAGVGAKDHGDGYAFEPDSAGVVSGERILDPYEGLHVEYSFTLTPLP